MKTKDRIKEEIGFYKLLMTLVFAILTSFGSWAWSSIVAFSPTAKLVCAIVIIFFAAIWLVLFILIDSKIRELDYDHTQ